MTLVRGIIAALFLVAVVAAGVVTAQSSPVKNAGVALGYVPPKTGTSLAVIGDSFSAGTAMGGQESASWTYLLAKANHLALVNESQIGAGYVNHVPGVPTFGKRVKALAKANAQWVILWDARDDITDKPVVVAKHMQATVQAVRATTGKDTKIIVVGPVATPYDNATTVAEQTALSTDEHNVYLKLSKNGTVPWLKWIDPIAEGWFNEQDGSAAFIGSDRAHPTDAGNEYIATKIQADLTTFGLGVDSPRLSSPVAPYIPTITTSLPPKTVVKRTTATRTTVSRVRVTVVERSPVVVTVTAPPLPS